MDSFEETTAEIIKTKLSLKTDVIATTNDKQFWLRYNITEKEFVQHLTAHSYVKDNDVLLVGIRFNKELKVRTAIEQLKEDKKIVFSEIPSNDDEIRSSISFTSSDIFHAFTFSNRQQSLIKFLDNETDTITNVLDESLNIKHEGYLGTFIDNGNCYDKYYVSVLDNISMLNLIKNKTATVKLPYLSKVSDSVTLLDTVELKASSFGNVDYYNEYASGKYLVLAKDIIFEQDNLYLEYQVGRI